MSQRPHHTRHLIPMLDTPVDLRVEQYSRDQIRACLNDVDGVVYAGGPLMDLPKQLVKHFYVIALARRMGKPVIFEGIGLGPFVRSTSTWVARRLLSTSHQITLRTSKDARDPAARGIEHTVSCDPAFDYLDTRGETLSLIPDLDRVWIERLLAGTEGHRLVGVNIRPIRNEYTVGVAEYEKFDYTQKVVARFEREFADGLTRFAEASDRPVIFIFFPMNAIQFGHSDLRSALQIQDHLPEAIDYRVWQGDASLDGVLELLRQLDVVIAMRFHATIFAYSQELPVIGVDYRVGERDKVAGLMGDRGAEEHCSRIDLLRADWLCAQLTQLTPD